LAKIEAVGAALKSLTEPIDTSTPAGRMMMQMLGAFAEFERSMIRERTKAGLNAARARGTQLGRRRSLDPFEEAELVNQYLTGDHSYKTLGQDFGISESAAKRAVYRRVNPTSSSLK
jgi:DNA invertase Pin-like site-specific DNA recombinase